MDYVLLAAIGCLILLIAMLLLSQLGHRLERRRQLTLGPDDLAGTSAVDGAIFALLGLLLAFTFGTAYARFNARREHIVQEANAIGTAYLRVDLLPADAQPALRQHFRDYVDSRVEMWNRLPDVDAAMQAVRRSQQLQAAIWTQAVSASEGNQSARMLLLPAINEMIDITSVRLSTMQARPPLLVYGMLLILALACSWLTGASMAKAPAVNQWHILAFATLIAFTIYVIIDLEHPSFGLIQLDQAEAMLAETRNGMQ